MSHWFNAYDDWDVPLNAERFPVTPPIEDKGDVLNFTEKRHGLEGHLAAPVVAQRIVLGLQSW